MGRFSVESWSDGLRNSLFRRSSEPQQVTEFTDQVQGSIFYGTLASELSLKCRQLGIGLSEVSIIPGTDHVMVRKRTPEIQEKLATALHALEEMYGQLEIISKDTGTLIRVPSKSNQARIQ